MTPKIFPTKCEFRLKLYMLAEVVAPENHFSRQLFTDKKYEKRGGGLATTG